MSTTIPSPVVSEKDANLVRSLIRSFPVTAWPEAEVESILVDALRLIRSIATKYADPKRVELNFDDLESEGRTKLIKRLQGTARTPSLLTQFTPSAESFSARTPGVRWNSSEHGRLGMFKHLKSCLNNHIKGIVHRNCFTGKRTGRKTPSKEAIAKGAEYERNWRPEISLDDEDTRRAVERSAVPEASKIPDISADMKEVLTPVEFLVYTQLTSPNSHALALATLESFRNRHAGAYINLKITQEQMADGLGMDYETFKACVGRIKLKVSNYMNQIDDVGTHSNAAITTLEGVFGVQIPRAMAPGTVRRLLTLVARDNYQKVTPEVETLLKMVGAKAPKKDDAGSLVCFGVLFQKNNRTCMSCGLNAQCQAEALNYDLGPIALSPKLFSMDALKRTAALTNERPAEVPTVAPVTEMVADEQAAPTSVVSAPTLSVRDEAIKSFLEANFKSAMFKGELYYRLQASRKGGKSVKYIFWLGQRPDVPGLSLRFCNPSDRIIKHLVKAARNTYYAPADMPIEQVSKLAHQHADETFKSL